MRLAAVVIGVWLVGASPSFAQEVEPLGPVGGGQEPILADGTLVWSRDDDGRVQVLGRPAAGGTVTEIARTTPSQGGLGGWRVAAGAGRVGVRVSLREGKGPVLFGGPFGSALTPLRPARAGAVMVTDRDFWAWAGGFVTLERSGKTLRAVVTDDRGGARVLTLPAGAEPRTLAVADTVAAVVVARERVDVLDLASGTVVRTVALGEVGDFDVTSLSVAADGALAVTADSGSDVLAWAPVGAKRFQVVLHGDGFGLVQVAGGRIAFVAPGGKIDASRPVVVEPRPDGEPTLIFRGPPAFQVESLDFDGVHVAWATQACQFVAKAEPAASTVTVPAGPCARTEIAITSFATPEIGRRHPSLPVYVRCLTAPTARCRLDVRAYGFDGRRLGRLRTTVPRGARRLLRVPLGRRDADRLRRADDNPTFFIIRTVDPDGKIRRLGPL